MKEEVNAVNGEESKVEYTPFKPNREALGDTVILKVVIDIDHMALNAYDNIDKWMQHSQREASQTIAKRYEVVSVGPRAGDVKEGDIIMVENAQILTRFSIPGNPQSWKAMHEMAVDYAASSPEEFNKVKTQKVEVFEYAFTKGHNCVIRIH